jgi:hypothetical protein
MITVGSITAQVRFDADFESGNLKSATTTDYSTDYVSTYEVIGDLFKSIPKLS